MADLVKAMKIRDSYRSTLWKIWETITKLDTPLIETSAAINAGIHQEFMSLDQKSAFPKFFTSFYDVFEPTENEEYPIFNADSDSDESDANVLHFQKSDKINELHNYIENHLMDPLYKKNYPNPPGFYRKSWGDLNFGGLYERGLRLDLHWLVSCTCLARGEARLPHMKCLMETIVDGSDDQLTRGEILCIIQIMAGRLNTKSLRPHVVAPIMVFSVMGPQHLRVLEAYYDGQRLIIRKTKLYDIEKLDKRTLDLFTRWWLGYATGETMEPVSC